MLSRDIYLSCIFSCVSIIMGLLYEYSTASVVAFYLKRLCWDEVKTWQEQALSTRVAILGETSYAYISQFWLERLLFRLSRDAPLQWQHSHLFWQLATSKAIYELAFIFVIPTCIRPPLSLLGFLGNKPSISPLHHHGQGICVMLQQSYPGSGLRRTSGETDLSKLWRTRRG